MKIMHLTKNFYPAQSGGPANSVYYLSKSLVNKNFEVFVIATDDDLNTKKIKRNQFLKFENINVIYTSNFSNKYPARLLCRSFFKIFNVDVVHQNSLFLPSLLITLLALLINKKVVIVFEVN